MTDVIELNGRRYNVATGVTIDHASRSVDGFMARPAPSSAASTHPASHRVGDSSPHHAKPHAAQHSQTLMRQAVHHPTPSFKRHAKTTAHTAALVKPPHFDIAIKHSAQTIDNDRLRRAGHIEHSEYIRRFAQTPLDAGPASPILSPPSRAAEPAHHESQVVAPVRQRPASSDVFERALAAANSHKEPYIPAKHTAKHGHRLRLVSGVAASLLAIALLVGFVGYQNYATIQLRLASSRAGINATLPIWQPSGFHLSALTNSPGNVAITYDNPTSGQSYTISQSATKWTAEALLDTYVYPNNQTYNTITAGSTTIYTYGSNSATWVNGGIWYKLVANGSLSTSQIVNIATSMSS